MNIIAPNQCPHGIVLYCENMQNKQIFSNCVLNFQVKMCVCVCVCVCVCSNANPLHYYTVQVPH